MKAATAKKGASAVLAQLNKQKSGAHLNVVEGDAPTRQQESAAVHSLLVAMREVDPKKVVSVPLSRVVDNPYNARHVYPQGKIDELAQSIKDKGQMTPAHGFPVEGRDGYWQLIDGQFRKRAIMVGGGESIDILPVTPCSDIELYRLSFLLNHERSAQTAYDNALSWKRLLDEKMVPDQESLAKMLNVSKTTVSKTLALLDLPEEVLLLVKSHAELFGREMGYALFLYAKTPNRTVEDVKALFWDIVDKNLSTRQVDRLREQAEAASGPRVREHSTTYPLKFPAGVKASLKEWSKQGRLSLDIRNMPEDRLVEIRDELLRILNGQSV